MSLALAGPVGGMVLVPLLVYLTAHHGFRTATMVAALLLWGSVLPLVAFVIKRRPQDVGLFPDGLQESEPGSGAVDAPGALAAGQQWSRLGALRTLRFWIIALPFSLAFIAQGGFLVHQLTFLQPALGQTQAAFAVSATTCAALDRIVLTMRGWIGGQTHRQAGVLGKIHSTPHELWPSAMVLWAIIQVDDQGGDVGKPIIYHFPPSPQTIDQTVTRHFGGNPIQKQFIQRWQGDAHGGHGRVWVKVVVGGNGRDTALATPGKRTDFDGRLGIHREASYRTHVGVN
jgi:hypothetical protein